MQILYCDDCGIRVDDARETENQKVYCANCAPKHASEFAPKPRTRPSGRAPGSGVHKAVPGTKSVNVPAQFRTPLPPPPAPEPEPEYFEEPQAPPGLGAWVRENKPIAIGGALAALAVLGVLLWMVLPGKKSTIAKVPDVPKPPDRIVQPDPKPPDPKPPEPKPPEPKLPEPKPPEPPKPDTTNPTYDFAKRKLEALNAKISSGKISGFEVKKELEYFMGPQLKGTPMQAEAIEMLKKYKDEMRPPDKADGAVPGVQARIGFPKGAELFGTEFKALETKTLPSINLSNTAALRTAFGRDADFAAKITGFIEVPKDGTYTFYLNSDDGSAFYIGKDPLINNAGMHQMTEKDAYLDLKAGKHAFRLDYYQGAGEAGLMLSWSGPGIIKEVVPATALWSIQKK